MFDLVAGSVDRPFREPHTAATAVSAAVHVAVLGAVGWVVLFSVTDTIPKVPTMMAFVAAAPPPPPPPPPPPAAPAARASQPSKPAPASRPIFAAPAAIPVGIHPEPLFDPGDEGGVVGGVEGGIAGGVLGGVLGGMVTEVMPPPPPPPRPAKPLRVGGELQAPALIHRVEPEYPGVAVSAKVAGIVVLEATVDEAGKVSDVTVLRSIPLLDKAAIKALKQWRYEPLMLNGTAMPFVLTVTLTFSIRDR